MYVCRFASDTPAELELVRSLCMDAGAFDARVANHWAQGGAGATELGQGHTLYCYMYCSPNN